MIFKEQLSISFKPFFPGRYFFMVFHYSAYQVSVCKINEFLLKFFREINIYFLNTKNKPINRVYDKIHEMTMCIKKAILLCRSHKLLLEVVKPHKAKQKQKIPIHD